MISFFFFLAKRHIFLGTGMNVDVGTFINGKTRSVAIHGPMAFRYPFFSLIVPSVYILISLRIPEHRKGPQ